MSFIRVIRLSHLLRSLTKSEKHFLPTCNLRSGVLFFRKKRMPDRRLSHMVKSLCCVTSCHGNKHVTGGDFRLVTRGRLARSRHCIRIVLLLQQRTFLYHKKYHANDRGDMLQNILILLYNMINYIIWVHVDNRVHKSVLLRCSQINIFSR